MSAVAAVNSGPDERVRHRDWDQVLAHAPLLAVTAWAYVDQLAVSMRPATVDVADNTLRCFAGFLVDSHPEIVGFVDVRRTHVEGFKVFFAAHSTVKGVPPARNTIRQRLGMLRSFFDRIIEWDWPDAPARTPIFAVDVPVADDPLPRFLDDAQAARFAAAAAVAVPFERLVIELLSRTGMRVGELCTLAGDAVVVLNGTPWLRIPVGKLHNDRYVPLHPNAARLLTDWTAANPPAAGRLLHRDGAHIDRHQIGRIVRKIGRRAGLGHVHPHQLRHTLATQAINRGMRLEAIATMLGHRSLRMTLTYARIANKTVADVHRGMSPKQAAWSRPGANRHNVWELVVHAAYWKYTAWRRLTGQARGSFPLKGSNWFRRPEELTDKAWRADVALLDEMHRSLMGAVEKVSARELHQTPRGSKVSNFKLLSGVAAHDLYHAGQIQLLKRLSPRHSA